MIEGVFGMREIWQWLPTLAPADRLVKYRPFEYEPIVGSKTFRLIRLLPPLSSGLHIEILEYNLDKPPANIPEYDALSYCWGENEGKRPDRRVVVDMGIERKEMFIYENLERALLSIGKEITDRPIFADQICINQEDGVERAMQVKLMESVYRQCGRVLVWLGPGSKASDSFFDFTNRVCGEPVVRALPDLDGQARVRVHDAVTDQAGDAGPFVRELSRIVEATDFPVSAYADVLRREWFGRLWIIQEAALPPQGLFVCGDRSTTFDAFRAVFYFYSIHNSRWNRIRGAMPAAEMRLRDDIFQLQKPFLRIFMERRLFHDAQRARPGLFDLVKKFNVNADSNKIGATKDGDRIFGLIGLAANDDPLLQLPYDPDWKAYIPFAREVVKRDVDVLLFAQGDRTRMKTTRTEDGREIALPSWIPDWSISRLDVPCAYLSLTEKPESPAGGPPSVGRPRAVSSVLRIQGIVLGRIAKIGQATIKTTHKPHLGNTLDYISLKGFFEEIELFLGNVQEIPEARTRLASAYDVLLAKLCLTDGGLTLASEPTTNAESLSRFYDGLKSWSDRLIKANELKETYISIPRVLEAHKLAGEDEVSASRLLSILRFFLRAADATFAVAMMRSYLGLNRVRSWLTRVPIVNREMAKVKSSVEEHLLCSGPQIEAYQTYILKNHGRRLYLTENGLVGLGPEYSKVGDFVAVLFGCSAPVVLRSTVETERLGLDGVMNCTYVGEAYCHGMMHGEAVSAGNGQRPTTFVIS